MMEKELRELNKKIETEDSVYNINAVTADKVNHTLTINKIGLNEETTPVEFSGEDNKEVSVVPAEGGRFKGPVRVGHNTEPSINDEAVLNYRDTIDCVFKEFKHYSTLYSWNKDAQESGKKFEPIISGNSPDSISLVQGLEGHLLSFAEENWYKKYLSVYLYLCTDTGNLYYGASPEQGIYQTPRRIANLADKALLANNALSLIFADDASKEAYTAERLAALFEKLSNVINAITCNETLEPGTVLKALVADRLYQRDHEQGGYTADELLEQIAALASALNTLVVVDKPDTAKNAAVLKSENSQKDYTADSLTELINSVTQELQEGDSNTLTDAKNYTDALKNGLTGGTVTVNKATNAANATNDSDGKVINKNYYRCSTFANKQAINTIYITTSSTESPTTNPVKGDIWIKY